MLRHRVRLARHAASNKQIIFARTSVRSNERPAPRNRHGRAGGIARERIRQHHIRAGEFSWLSGTLHRRLLSEFLDRVFGHGRGDQGRPDRPECDGVGSNALFRQYLGKTAREVLDRAFRGPIGQQRRIRRVGIDRGGVDDRTAGLHVRHSSLGEVEDRSYGCSMTEPRSTLRCGP